MANSDKVVVIIPARLDSSRLKKKLLMEIEGRPMITHVWERAVSANIGKVLVATDSIEIGEQIHVLGGDVIITEFFYKSNGSVYEYIELYNTTISDIPLKNWKLDAGYSTDVNIATSLVIPSKKMVVLAGGFGTRLSEYTEETPKPMVQIGDMPILMHIIKRYLSYGHKDFYIATGYKSEFINKYFASLGDLKKVEKDQNLNITNL